MDYYYERRQLRSGSQHQSSRQYGVGRQLQEGDQPGEDRQLREEQPGEGGHPREEQQPGEDGLPRIEGRLHHEGQRPHEDEQLHNVRQPLEREQRHNEPYFFPTNVSNMWYRWHVSQILIERRAKQIGVSLNAWKAIGLFLSVSALLYMVNWIAYWFDLDFSSFRNFWIIRRNLWFNMDSPIQQFILVPLSLVMMLIISPCPTFPSDQVISFIISTMFAVLYFYFTGEDTLLIPWYHIILLGLCFFSLMVLVSVDYCEPGWYVLSRTFVILLVMYLEGYRYFLYVCACLGLLGETFTFSIALRRHLNNVHRHRRSNNGS